MAKFALVDARHYVDGYDLTGDSNRIELMAEVDERDSTTFGSAGWRTRIGGLKNVAMSAGGYISLGDGEVDDILFDGLATAAVISSSPTGDDGDSAFTFKARNLAYQHTGTLGELAAWTGSAAGRDGAGLIRGTLLHDDSTARTSTSTGTARQLGAVDAAEKLYATLHVLAVSGTNPTLDVIVESDDAQGFASGTTRITFAEATAVGAQWATPVAGAIADDWHRVSYTIGGTDTPTFSFVVIVGII
jgi:hypothetical protein